jgi:hypothetical protein
MQDWVADYDREGPEQAVYNNGIRQEAGQQSCERRKKSSLLSKKTFFNDAVCLVEFLLPPKQPMICFWFISLKFSRVRK